MWRYYLNEGESIYQKTFGSVFFFFGKGTVNECYNFTTGYLPVFADKTQYICCMKVVAISRTCYINRYGKPVNVSHIKPTSDAIINMAGIYSLTF